MRKSAFIRRYRTTLKDTYSSNLKITPVRLFENTNTRFAIARDDTTDSFNTGVLPFSSYNPHLASATTQVANNFSALCLGSMTETLTADFVLSDKQKCSSSRRDTAIRPLDLSVPRNKPMAPTMGTVAGPILNQRDGILGQTNHQQISPVVASNNFQSKMISEISPPQRDIFSMLQPQNVQQPGLEAFHHQQQQMAQLHALQQQQQHMGIPQQPPQHNRGLPPTGNMSPPRPQLPMGLTPPQQMRPKRAGQVEAFQQNEPLNKRSTPSFLPNLTPQMQQQLSVMNNTQQMTLLQQVQHQQQMQQHQQQQQHHQQQQQSLPTSAAMQLSALQARLPPPRLPYSGPGFAAPPPAYNSPNSVISQNESLQNHLRALQQVGAGMPTPSRPSLTENDLASIMALINAQNNQNRAFDELKRSMPNLENPFMREELKMFQAKKNIEQQQQQHQQQHQQQQLMQMAAAEQQRQQQNAHRRQSLPQPVPHPLSLIAQAANHAVGLPLSNICNTLPSPSKEGTSTSSSATSAAGNSSPTHITAVNGLRGASPSTYPGPGERRYQLFLHSIDLFNRGEDKESITQRYEIPEKVAEAALLTHQAQIPMPSPTIALDHPSLRDNSFDVPSTSAAPAASKEQSKNDSE
jgi:hypothetical protein